MLLAWQRRLLPVVIVSILVLGAIFFSAALMNYRTLEQSFVEDSTSISANVASMASHRVDLRFQELYLRTALEERQLQNRFKISIAAIKITTWTRMMGFAAGMVLVITGCLFVISKFEVQFEGSAGGAGQWNSLKTNSPGVVLAVSGSLLLGICLNIRAGVDDKERSTYLPAIVEEVSSSRERPQEATKDAPTSVGAASASLDGVSASP
jgi:hypothetical protein